MEIKLSRYYKINANEINLSQIFKAIDGYAINTLKDFSEKKISKCVVDTKHGLVELYYKEYSMGPKDPICVTLFINIIPLDTTIEIDGLFNGESFRNIFDEWLLPLYTIYIKQ